MTTNNNFNKTEQLFVASANFRIWSGQRKLDVLDINFGEGAERPSDDVVELGSKRIIDPKELNIFSRLKRETERFLASHGMTFLGGYACPIDKQDIIMERLEDVRSRFASIKSDFLSTYATKVNEWIEHVYSVTSDVEFANKLKDSVLTESEVERRLAFDFQVFKLQPVSDDEAVKLENRISGLGQDLIDEVVTGANKFAATLFNRDRVAVTTRMTLVGIRDKVDGLAFLNGNLQPLADLISDTLRGYQLHSEGRYITAPFLYQVMATAFILSDRKKINAWAEGSIDIDEYADHYANDACQGAPVIVQQPAKAVSPDSLDVIAKPAKPAKPVEVEQSALVASFDDLDDLEGGVEAVAEISVPVEIPVAEDAPVVSDVPAASEVALVASDAPAEIEDAVVVPDASVVANHAAAESVTVDQDFFF